MKRRSLSIAVAFTLLLQCVNVLTPTFAASQNDGEKTVLLEVKKGVDLSAFIDKKGLKNKKPKMVKSINTLILPLNATEIQSLKADSDVQLLEEDKPVIVASLGGIDKNHDSVKKMKKNDDTIPWGVRDIGADQALTNHQDGKGVRIAVLDTGVAEHPDIKVSGGVSFVDGVTSYKDDHGHGTHVAGTIAALNNKFGVVGVAPKSDIYAVKVLDSQGIGSYSRIVQGIDWAIENKINIISI